MFKKILLASVLAVLVIPVSSVKAQQWANSPFNLNNIYNSNTGFVGIGTNNPSNKLVVGDDSSGATFVPDYSISLGHVGGDSAIQLGTGSTTKGYLKWINASNSFQIGTAGTYPIVMQTGGGNVGIGTTIPTTKLWVQGIMGSSCSAGQVTTQFISAIGWYQGGTSYGACTADPAKIRIFLTQDNSGSGDISIISMRVKKNGVFNTSFNYEYYVNAVPTAGTTKINWMAIQGP